MSSVVMADGAYTHLLFWRTMLFGGSVLALAGILFLKARLGVRLRGEYHERQQQGDIP